jgi:putative IMPACT (imprinted ancient) family translation regulator
MPYYIYIITANESSHSRSVSQVSEFDTFKLAKTEIKRLRAEQPLAANQIYKIIFADDTAAAEKSLKEVREQPIAREWEK